ncbi:hypothetical protein A2U01_0010839 [Trifolium medium]|uniref:Uncharacterized protein n=1 Tax=Trifolium medium TaxID=97028 RepID=A0A392MSB7_9FABA|nr:hypothetical protein [Trifolium medium]
MTIYTRSENTRSLSEEGLVYQASLASPVSLLTRGPLTVFSGLASHGEPSHLESILLLPWLAFSRLAST